MTLKDGSHVPITEELAKALWEEVIRQRDQRLANMPTEAIAHRQLHEAYTRLQELGWKNPIYATADGECDMIELGSSGIHVGCYSDAIGGGKTWWYRDEMDTANPVLVKPHTPTERTDNG
jgi:hypothetical protein